LIYSFIISSSPLAFSFLSFRTHLKISSFVIGKLIFLNKKFKDYSQNMTKNLDELHSTNPKDFWKLLNKGKRKNQSDIGIDKLFDFLLFHLHRLLFHF
jgi:hypothetical protein